VKKILIVGGGVNQMPLIHAAKESGCHVIVVDRAGEKCPGYTIADRFYNVSTQDEKAILEVAMKEGIDGIISNSEASMLIVNIIAAKLNLIGNSIDGIKSILSKSKFRDLQRRVGVYAPAHYELTTAKDAMSVAERLKYPIIIKPCESSASRGCRKVEQFAQKDIEEAFQVCEHHSRNKKVVIEEWVTMPSLQTIEGDIFVFGDTILWDGLFYTTRAAWAPMVPMTYTAPLLIDNTKLNSIKSTISQILNAAGIRFGEFNIEGFFTESDEFFVIEINARQGGNFLPGFLHRFTGIDYNRLLVTTCVNDDYYWNSILTTPRNYRYVILNSVYSQTEGAYKGLRIDPSIKDNVKDVRDLLSVGDKVERCVDGTSIVASVMFELDNMKELYDITPKIVNNIHVELS
jgi:biotin carboxylase